MNPLEVEIIHTLAQSPVSYSEMVFFLPKRRPAEIKVTLRALVTDGRVVQLKGRDDEGAPVYALAGYVEETRRRDHSDVILARNYERQYDAPGWRGDV